MKKYFYLLITFSTLILASETLMSNMNIKSGGFGGPRIKIANIQGANNILIGGGGSWVINDTFSIGLHGLSQVVSFITNDENTDTGNQVGISYGGIRIGYNLATESAFNPFTAVSLNYGVERTGPSEKRQYSYFNNIELEIGSQIKITKWFRIEPYIGYVIDNSTQQSINYNDVLTYGINFNFGKWNKK